MLHSFKAFRDWLAEKKYTNHSTIVSILVSFCDTQSQANFFFLPIVYRVTKAYEKKWLLSPLKVAFNALIDNEPIQQHKATK